jgi:CheY-like chemotaxis protein
MRIIRQDPATRDLKVIILSAFYTTENQETAAKYGARRFVKKPWDEKELRKIVERVLKQEYTYQPS